MSLVNYYSSSDDENSGDEEKTDDYVDAEIGSVDSSISSRQASESSLFSSLPAPKSSQISSPEESESTQSPTLVAGTSSHGRLGSLNLPLPKKRSTQPIKITAPSLPETNSDDEEDEPTAKRAKPAKTKYNLFNHESLRSRPNNDISSSAFGNHMASEDHMNPRNSRRLPLVCPPGLDYSLLANNKTGKETKEHTMEELVEFSRVAMEQLHKKLELQRKQLLLLSEGSSTNQRSGASLPVKESPVSAIAAQGLMHTIPPGWHFHGNPLINAALHPGLASFTQTPSFEAQAAMLSSQTLPFALPVGASAGNHANNPSTNVPNPLSFAPMNPANVGPQVGLARFLANTATEVHQPAGHPAPGPNTKPSSSADPDQETHSNCCIACLKRIDVLERKVKKILEHLINKELSQGQQVPSLSGPFPITLTQSSQETLQQGVSSDTNSPSRATLQTLAQVGQEFHSAFMDSLQEQSNPPSMSKPKVVYPRQLNESPVLMNKTLPSDNDKYDYQTLMRYKGGSKVRTESEQFAVHKLNISQSTLPSAEDSQLSDLPPVIYSAAVFESLPPKIQNILNILEKNRNGTVTRLEVKQDILTSLTPYVKDRGSIARRLADVLFTDDERCFCNCSGWRKPAALDPIRMQALTDAVFKLCPAPDDQKKHLWHDCVKSIDAASRHIVRIRKNKGKMPRQGKWLPFGNKGRQDRLNIVAPMIETDPNPDTVDYNNLPLRLQSLLNIIQNGNSVRVEIKDSVLAQFHFLSNNRLNVACQLADILFTPEERKGASCLGRHGKRLLDPVRVEALREGTFKVCPAPLMEQKHLWSYCMKAIDRLTVIPEMMEASSVSPVCLSDSDDVPIKTEETFEDGNQFIGNQFICNG